MVAVRQIDHIITITQAEAEAKDRRIKTSIETVGKELNALKETEGWRWLKDEEGQEYKNWTDFLSRRYQWTRKHLYELMAAAPAQERLAAYGYTVPIGQAALLNKYPEHLQVTIMEAAKTRYGGVQNVTESRLERVANTFTQAARTGHVNTGDGGKSTPIDAALDLEDLEAMKRAAAYRRDQETPRTYLASAVEAAVRLIGKDSLTVWSIPVDAAALPMLRTLQPGQKIRMSVWVEG